MFGLNTLAHVLIRDLLHESLRHDSGAFLLRAAKYFAVYTTYVLCEDIMATEATKHISGVDVDTMYM